MTPDQIFLFLILAAAVVLVYLVAKRYPTTFWVIAISAAVIFVLVNGEPTPTP